MVFFFLLFFLCSLSHCLLFIHLIYFLITITRKTMRCYQKLFCNLYKFVWKSINSIKMDGNQNFRHLFLLTDVLSWMHLLFPLFLSTYNRDIILLQTNRGNSSLISIKGGGLVVELHKKILVNILPAEYRPQEAKRSSQVDVRQDPSKEDPQAHYWREENSVLWWCSACWVWSQPEKR